MGKSQVLTIEFLAMHPETSVLVYCTLCISDVASGCFPAWCRIIRKDLYRSCSILHNPSVWLVFLEKCSLLRRCKRKPLSGYAVANSLRAIVTISSRPSVRPPTRPSFLTTGRLLCASYESRANLAFCGKEASSSAAAILECNAWASCRCITVYK